VPTVILTIRLAEAAVFAVASVAKLRDPATARLGVRAAGVPDRAVSIAARVLSMSELATAAVLLAGPARWAALMAVAMTGVFSAALGRRALHGDLGRCHCLGRRGGRIGWATIARNAVLSGGAIVLLAAVGH
jgi:hypothetical protein